MPVMIITTRAVTGKLDSRTYRKMHFLADLAPRGLRYLKDHTAMTTD